jgi:ribosome biogenesis protein SSF1/2
LPFIVKKTAKESRIQKLEHSEKVKLREQRRKEQEENVARKKAAIETGKDGSQGDLEMADGSEQSEEEEEEGDESDWDDEEQVIEDSESDHSSVSTSNSEL